MNLQAPFLCFMLQFCESMQVILKGLAILMASFSEVYYSDGGVLERATHSIWHSEYQQIGNYQYRLFVIEFIKYY